MIKQKIENLISSGRIKEALQLLLTVTEGNDEDLNHELILLSSQLSANNRRYAAGLLAYDKLKLSENTIINSLIEVLRQINKQDFFENLKIEDLEKGMEFGGSKKKSKILFIASNPVGTPKFQLEKEYLGIRKIFIDKREEFELVELFDTQLDELFEYVQKERPEIIHISAPANDEYLYFHDENNLIDAVSYQFLSSAFLMFENHTNCLFINTWVSPIFLKRTSKVLNYSIGSDGEITDENSMIFSSGFYTGISLNKSIEDAFELGMEVLISSEKKSTKGIDKLLLFKTGYCLNKEDNYPESFPMNYLNATLNNDKP